MNAITSDTSTYTIEGYPSKYFRFPTGNCQLGIISSFYSVLSKVTDKKVLQYIKTISQKNLVLVDIKQDFDYKIIELNRLCNDKLVILKSNYVSSNGSLMMIVIFDTRQITYEQTGSN